MPVGKRAHTQGRVSVSDALKRRELLEEFMFWYFDGFLMPLLKVRRNSADRSSEDTDLSLVLIFKDDVLYHGIVGLPQQNFVLSAG